MTGCFSLRHQTLFSDTNPEPAGYKPSAPTIKTLLTSALNIAPINSCFFL